MGLDIEKEIEKELDNKTILEKLSKERKDGIKNGTVPDWFVTPSYQLFTAKYQRPGMTIRETYQVIAKKLASHMSKDTKSGKNWEQIFFDLMWKGWVSLSTPALANVGTNRGCPVSCSGNYIADEIYKFYDVQTETAVLTQNGFGTSSYLSDIRPRGAKISSGGYANGIIPVIKDYVQLSRDVSQGGVRRGAWAGYIDIMHEDFYEIIDLLEINPDDLNIGWIIRDKFIENLNNLDKEATTRFAKALKTKCVTGKGYFFFVDKVNRANPQMYKDMNLEVKASNLCTEITLTSDIDHTFTCVLSSMNLAKYDEWKNTSALFDATVLVDCIAQEFIEYAQHIKGLERAVRFTEKSRALGLGVLGFHTYLQENMIAFESFEATLINGEIFEKLNDESLKASKWMAEVLGEPEWCRGYGLRNTHRLAIAPTSSTSTIMGGVSRGVEPIVMNVYNETGPAGEISRINPTLLKIMKERKVYNKKTLFDIIENNGSVQHVDWLNENEKLVFRTAFEINQEAIIRLAASRQKFIDQAQSINLFFSADEDESYIAKIHQVAFMNENIKSLYYLRSQAGIQASKDACIACAD